MTERVVKNMSRKVRWITYMLFLLPLGYALATLANLTDAYNKNPYIPPVHADDVGGDGGSVSCDGFSGMDTDACGPP